MRTQVAFVQLPVPLANVHALPHMPQFAGDVSRSVSQPLPRLPSQLPKLVLQAAPHAPAAHDGMPLATAAHTLPQAPQLLTSTLVARSQPLKLTPSQFEKPALHEATTHALALQAAIAFGRLHGLPQPPQLLGSDASCDSQPLPAFA